MAGSGYLTVGEAANTLGICESDILMAAEGGEVPFLRLSTDEIVIPAEAISMRALAVSSRALLVLQCDNNITSRRSSSRRSDSVRRRRTGQVPELETLQLFDANSC
jgi:hypothetical protein